MSNKFVMDKLLLIDGNAILHRAFHAMPPFMTKSGEPIGAVHGFVSMLLKAIQDLKPTDIAVAFDEKEKTFRHVALATYQAQRPPMAEDLSSQFGKAKDFLKAARIPIYSKPGFEADDVIGTIATKFSVLGDQSSDKSLSDSRFSGKLKTDKLNSENGQQKTENRNEVIIVTGDRDQLQLVNDKSKIRLYMPITGLTNAKLYDEVATMDRMGVPASLVDDYKALVGDPSDNYSGVPGIGPKTAINLLTKYGSFENIYKNLKDIPESTKNKLVSGEDAGRLSKKLATIVRDVPIDINFEEMSKWRIDSPEVLRLFEEKFGFKTLTARVKSVGKEIESEKQEKLF